MDTEVSEFIDNFLEKLDVGQDFCDKDLDKLLDVVDGKLNSLSSKMEEIGSDLEIECKKLNSSTYNKHCEFDPLAMQCFLNNIIQAAERNVGFEDHIAKILVDFCYHNCIVLPSSSLITSLNYLSINSLENDLLTDQSLLWSKLLIKMRNGLTNMLSLLPMSNTKQLSISNINMTSQLDFLNKRRFYLFQLLNVFFSFNETITLYCKVRENQLLLNHFDSNDNPVRALSNLERTMEHHHIMLNEDSKLIQSVFTDELDASPSKKLFAVYSKDICSKLRDFTVFYSCDNYIKNSKIHTFTIKDLKLFAKAISILQMWHEQIKVIVVYLNDKKTQNNVFEAQEDRESLRWEKELNQFYPALSASVVSYLKCLPNAIFQDSEFLKMIYISDDILLTNPAYPKKVSFKCSQFLTLIFEMLVFTKIKDISEAIHTTMSDVFNQYYNHLMQINDSFNTSEKRNIDSLNMILCDCALLECLLAQWEENEFKKKHSIYYLLIQKFKNLKTDIINSIISYHLFTLRSALVYDIHSNNWGEDRKFYEDERCSFPVQMWNFYIRGVAYDLIDMMPQALYHEILYKISNDMLIFFVGRYSIVKPSYHRLSQVKVDIIVLLKSFQWLCFHLMDDEVEFFSTTGKFKLFHALLTNLTHILIILSAPLNLVADYFERKISRDINKIHWRDILNTCLNEKMLVMLEILTCKPRCNKRLLLKLLTWNNVELPISIYHYSSYLLNATVAYPESIIQNIHCMFVIEKVLKLQSIKKKQIAHCFYDIFLSYSETSFICFMASMIKDDYSKSFKKNDVEELPLWLQLIADNISSVMKRILKPAYELIFEKDLVRAAPSFNFTNIQTLPCGCATAPEIEEKAFQSWSIQLHECLMVTLNSLVDNIAIIPKVIWILLVYVRDECNFAPSWIKQKQLGTKVLASLLYNWLSNPCNITSLSCNDISPEILDRIKMFSELLWHVVYNLTYDVTENPKVSMDIYKYLQNSSEVIIKRLTDLDAWCNLKKHETNLNDGNLLLIEKKNDSLQFIYSLLKHNKQSVKEIIMNKNDVSIEKLQERFNASLKSPEIDFNPISEFKMVGEEGLDTVFTDDDWNIFFPMIPFSKLKSLVTNKFEFQESAESTLLEHEKNALKKIIKFIT